MQQLGTLKKLLLSSAILAFAVLAHADTASDLATKKASFPAYPFSSNNPYAKDCADKYTRSVAAISAKTIAQSTKAILAQIDDDLKKYDRQAIDGKNSRNAGKMSALAETNAKWLRESVRPFVQSLAAIK